MKRTIIGKCLVVTLCAFSFTGFAGPATTTAVTAPETEKSTDQKTIDNLRVRVEKLELFATVINTGYTGNNRDLGETMVFVIKLSRQGNRFADQWVKKKLAEIGSNLTEQIEVANMYSSNPDPNVRDKEKALHYAMLAYSQTTNTAASQGKEYPGEQPYQINGALEVLAAAYAINGNFQKAIEAEEKAITNKLIDVAAQHLPAKIEAISINTSLSPMKKRLELYKQKLPYIEGEGNNIGNNLWEMSGLPKFESAP